jgi:hypothetical protein
MFAIRRKAVESAGRLPAAVARATSRYSTAQHGKTGDKVQHFAGESTEHEHHTAGPKAESLGVSGFSGRNYALADIVDCLLPRPCSPSHISRSLCGVENRSRWKAARLL